MTLCVVVEAELAHNRLTADVMAVEECAFARDVADLWGGMCVASHHPAIARAVLVLSDDICVRPLRTMSLAR